MLRRRKAGPSSARACGALLCLIGKHGFYCAAQKIFFRMHGAFAPAAEESSMVELECGRTIYLLTYFARKGLR
jgi:hypothetical protein